MCYCVVVRSITNWPRSSVAVERGYIAIVRLEQYYPLSEDVLLEALRPIRQGPFGVGPGRNRPDGSVELLEGAVWRFLERTSL